MYMGLVVISSKTNKIKFANSFETNVAILFAYNRISKNIVACFSPKKKAKRIEKLKSK